MCSILKFFAIFGSFVANAESGKKQEQQNQLGYETNNPMVCVCSKLNFLTNAWEPKSIWRLIWATLQIYTAGIGTHVKSVKVTSICHRYYHVKV